MHKLGVFPFFVTIGDILQHKLYSVITIGVMLQINLKLVLVLVLRCNLPSQIVTPLCVLCVCVLSVLGGIDKKAIKLKSIHHKSQLMTKVDFQIKLIED